MDSIVGHTRSGRPIIVSSGELERDAAASDLARTATGEELIDVYCVLSVLAAKEHAGWFLFTYRDQVCGSMIERLLEDPGVTIMIDEARTWERSVFADLRHGRLLLAPYLRS